MHRSDATFNKIISQFIPSSNQLLNNLTTLIDDVNSSLPDSLKVDVSLVNNTHSAAHLNIGCSTGINHTEFDMNCATVIRPKQLEEQAVGDLEFVFRINNETEFVIPMTCNTTFIYNAYFLSHNQKFNDNNNSIKPINISTYSSRRLSNNMCRTIQRMVKNAVCLQEKG